MGFKGLQIGSMVGLARLDASLELGLGSRV